MLKTIAVVGDSGSGKTALCQAAVNGCGGCKPTSTAMQPLRWKATLVEVSPFRLGAPKEMKTLKDADAIVITIDAGRVYDAEFHDFMINRIKRIRGAWWFPGAIALLIKNGVVLTHAFATSVASSHGLAFCATSTCNYDNVRRIFEMALRQSTISIPKDFQGQQIVQKYRHEAVQTLRSGHTWSPMSHASLPNPCRELVTVMFLICRWSKTPLVLLPREVLMLIVERAVAMHSWVVPPSKEIASRAGYIGTEQFGAVSFDIHDGGRKSGGGRCCVS